MMLGGDVPIVGGRARLVKTVIMATRPSGQIPIRLLRW